MLESICLKYNIDITELETEIMKERFFEPENKEHREFIAQVLSSVVGKRDTYKIIKKKLSPVIIHMTDLISIGKIG